MIQYEIFHQLHHRAAPLLIANVWNVKSAQVAEASGFEAMATSSGAVAESWGYKDGEQISFSELLYVVQRIRACTGIPLSVDLEGGYTDNLTVLNDHVQKLIDLGVVGINLEDQQGEDIYLRKLEGISSYLTRTGQQLFINSRTDVFLQKPPDPMATTLRRAQRYRDAGANGLFVTGVSDPEVIAEIVKGTSLPVNVVGVPALASVADLAACGVKRISMAVQLYKSTYGRMEMMAKEILNKQSLEPLF